MLNEVKHVFSEVADLSADERERYFERHPVPPEVRAELESLLRYDSDQSLTFSQAVQQQACEFFETNSLDSPTSISGQLVGAYTLISEIGHGGMGRVWLAERNDGRFEGRVAVKFLNLSLTGRSGGERFRREGSILARLGHPNITRLLDAGVSPSGQPYLVLEFVDGEHINQYSDSRRLSAEARVRLFLDVLAAISHAHVNLVVHRDIKPANVLVTPEGQVKLLDFGIAKLLEDTERPGAATVLTREAGCALTIGYAAPEQVTGGAVTTATDVYSAGVLLYVLLGGQRPSGSVAESIQVAANADFPRIPGLPEDLETIVHKALKKDPAERYSSAGAFSDDLRRYLNHEPIQARPDTWTYRTEKFLRRHWRAVAAGTAAVLFIATFTAFYTVRLAAERNRAQLEAEKATKVSDLLTTLLTAADPYATPEIKEPTLRGILDAGAVRVEKELAGQPDIKAQLLTVIGRVYERLGAYDKALPLLEEAVAIGRTRPPTDVLARSLNDLGALRSGKGDYAAAVPILEEALDIRRRLLGPEHQDVAQTITALSIAYRNHGDAARAEALARESLRIRRKVLGDANTETATSFNDLALLLWDRGELPEAASLLRQSLTVFRKTLGEENANTASVVNNLALVTEDLGDQSNAEALFREGLAIRRKVLDAKSPAIAVSLNNLSHLLREKGQYEEAASELRQALAIAGPALGEDHPMTAAYMSNLGAVFMLQKNAAAAEPLFRKAVEIRRKKLRPGDWRTASAESQLGAALTELGRYREAEPLLAGAAQILKDAPGAQGQGAKLNRERLERWKKLAANARPAAP